jgi:hypothetical protein
MPGFGHNLSGWRSGQLPFGERSPQAGNLRDYPSSFRSEWYDSGGKSGSIARIFVEKSIFAPKEYR